MKIEFIKQKAFDLNGVKLFDIGESTEVPDHIGSLLIQSKYAVEVKAEKPEPKVEAEKPKEQTKKEKKQHKAKREDKQLKTSDKEDK